ncbi:hypothetical protein [Paraburkholderia sp. ZP32-5]|uniref:hypothetical protein n=1 Tax=Paraburkholderia sp. ZP32-5 TaxID=2883245 RepID=UPI001F35CDC7|nr:hypothetical protein [Paraburkholderia sp. ZP32-5]
MRWPRVGRPTSSPRALFVAMMLIAASGHAWAQEIPASTSAAASAPEAASTGAPSKRVCVNVEVNGQTALSYDCLSQQLAPTTIPASGDADAGNIAKSLATAPSNRVGTFNYSAESIRFGSNWGKSVIPQRPSPVPVVPPR